MSVLGQPDAIGATLEPVELEQLLVAKRVGDDTPDRHRDTELV